MSIENEPQAAVPAPIPELERQLIAEGFPPMVIDNLKGIVYYLSKVGLDFDEACKMSRVNPAEMKKIVKTSKTMQQLIERKELEYKTGLIKTVSEKAHSGDDKLALWLLERRYPAEFNPKKGTGTNDTKDADLLGMAIEFIQRSGDSQPLVRETAGRAFVFKKNSQEDIMKNVNDFLK